MYSTQCNTSLQEALCRRIGRQQYSCVSFEELYIITTALILLEVRNAK